MKGAKRTALLALWLAAFSLGAPPIVSALAQSGREPVGAESQRGASGEAERKEFLQKYVRYLTAEEARRWVRTQGVSFIYVGEKELFPGLGEALRGKRVKVYVGEGVDRIPWLERAGTKYALYRMPGKLLSEEGVLVAQDAYVLGSERTEKGKPTGRFVLITYPEGASVLYRIFSAYEGFAKEVKR